MANPTIFKLRYEGKPVAIEVDDLDRAEWRPLKVLLGKSEGEILAEAIKLDLDAFAGLLWIWLRREQPDLAYDSIKLSLADVFAVDEVDDAVPPASGGRSSSSSRRSPR